MADDIQKYRPAPLQKVKRFLARRDTTYITLPGQQLPIPVQLPRPRQWPWLLGMAGAVVGTAFVVTRLLTPTPSVSVSSRPSISAGCVPDVVQLSVSQIKDRMQIFVNDRLISTIKYGEVIAPNGTVARTFNGAAWGLLNLSQHLQEGDNMLRIVGVHDKGLNAGAVAELKQNGTTVHVVSHPFGLHDRTGVFLDQRMPIRVTTCLKEHDYERTPGHQ